MKAIYIINENHKMSYGQLQLLASEFEELEWMIVPAHGWNSEEMREKEDYIFSSDARGVVFVSPIPIMMCRMIATAARADGYDGGMSPLSSFRFFLFHSDLRISKEIKNPDGTVQITRVVDPDQMELVMI